MGDKVDMTQYVKDAVKNLENLADTFTDSTRSISNAPASLEFELGSGDYSAVAYADAAKFTVDGAKEFATDIASVGSLEVLLKQGREYVNMLYTFRSIRKSLTMVDEKTANNKDAYYHAAYKILHNQFYKLTQINNFATVVRNETLENIKRMLAKKQAKEGAEVVSEGLYERIVDIIDMMVCLDSLKDMKASLLNEFSLFKRIFEKVKPVTPDAPAVEEQIRIFQNFAVDTKGGSKNVIFFKFRDELQRKPGYESILTDIIDHCLLRLDERHYLFAEEKHKYIRAIPHLMLLIDQEKEAGKDDRNLINVFTLKSFNFEKCRAVMKRYPVVPLFGDVQIVTLYIVQRCPNWTPDMVPKWKSKTMEENAEKSANRLPPEYDLVEAWPTIRKRYNDILPHLVNMINEVERIHQEKKKDKNFQMPQDLGAVVISSLHTGLRALSEWSAIIQEQAAYKFKHPAPTHLCCQCKEEYPRMSFNDKEWSLSEKNASKLSSSQPVTEGACNDCLKLLAMMARSAEGGGGVEINREEAVLMASKTVSGKGATGHEYARVVRFNYSDSELAVLIDVISMIKSVASVIKKAEVVLAGPIRMGIHNDVQNFVQNRIVEWLHTTDKSDDHKRYKWVRDILLKLRESVVDWKDGVASLDDYKESKKVRGEHSVESRGVAPSSTQLFFVRTMIRALYDDNSPGVRESKWRRVRVLQKADVEILKTFYNQLIKFDPLLDLGSSVRRASDLSDLWYREFFMEMTKCIQFPIEMSFPWIITEYALKKPSSDMMENVLYALDVYNDAANRALHVLKQQYLYDEVEAEVNLVFDQLVFMLCETIYGYYKNLAAASLLDKPYKLKLQEIRGVTYLETDKRRYEVLMTQKRIQLLGRTVNLSELIAQRINDYMLRDLDAIIVKFESSDLTHIIELDNLLEIMRLTHKTLADYLSLDAFESMLAEANEAVAPTSYRGRIAIHTLQELLFDLLPNSTYNSTTKRFVKNDVIYEEKIERRKMLRGIPGSFIYGTRCAKAYERAYRLRKEYFGISHAASMTRVLGYSELPMIVEEIVNNLIIAEIDGGMLSQYVQVLKEGMVPCKLPHYSYKLGGCYAFFDAKLQELVKYGDLKSRVFHLFRVIGNSLALLHLLEGETDMDDLVGFQHTAAFLGSTIDKVVPTNTESGPLVEIVSRFTVDVVPKLQPSTAKVASECLFAAKRAHAMHFPSTSSLLLLRPALRKIAEAVKKQSSIFCPPPKNGYMEAEACDSFHRLWSALQFLYLQPVTLSGNKPDEHVFGDGFSWGGITLVYLCGQMNHFEMLDFSYHLLRVAEWETDVDQAKKQQAKMSNRKDTDMDVGGEFQANAAAFVRTASKQKAMNEMLFSIVENALPDPLGTGNNIMVVHPPEDDTSLDHSSKMKVVKIGNEKLPETTPSASRTASITATASAPAKPKENTSWFGSTPAPPKLDANAPKFEMRNPLDTVVAALPPPPPVHEIEEEENQEEEVAEEEEVVEEENEAEVIVEPPSYPLPEGAVWAVALWAYDAVEDGELSFRENEFVAVTSTPDGGWWEGFIPGQNGDSIGMFPSNYVELR